MASSSTEAEEEYMRARSGEGLPGARSGNGEQLKTPDGNSAECPEPEVLDDSISAESAASLKEQGNSFFKEGDNAGSLEKYSEALRSAHLADHDRAVLHANCAAVHVRLEAWKEAKEAATRALDVEPTYSKALLRRKKAAEKLEDWSTAAQDAKALGAPAGEIVALETKAKQQAEREKDEAMEQLKGIGNSLLSNFGLSLDSFQMDKDPDTGSYSIKMKQ